MHDKLKQALKYSIPVVAHGLIEPRTLIASVPNNTKTKCFMLELLEEKQIQSCYEPLREPLLVEIILSLLPRNLWLVTPYSKHTPHLCMHTPTEFTCTSYKLVRQTVTPTTTASKPPQKPLRTPIPWKPPLTPKSTPNWWSLLTDPDQWVLYQGSRQRQGRSHKDHSRASSLAAALGAAPASTRHDDKGWFSGDQDREVEEAPPSISQRQSDQPPASDEAKPQHSSKNTSEESRQGVQQQFEARVEVKQKRGRGGDGRDKCLEHKRSCCLCKETEGRSFMPARLGGAAPAILWSLLPATFPVSMLAPGNGGENWPLSARHHAALRSRSLHGSHRTGCVRGCSRAFAGLSRWARDG